MMKKLRVVILILSAILLQQFASFCQLGLTYDSHDYLYAAHSFQVEGVLRNANHSRYVERTPLYPLCLAGLGKNPALLSKYLNALCLGLTLWLVYILSSQMIGHSVLQLLYILTQIWGIPLLFVHSFLWSEPFFMVFLYSHLYYLHLYLRRPRGIWMLGMIAFSALMALQRNPGVFFILGTSIVLLLWSRASFWRVLAYVFFSSVAWLWWTGQSIYYKGWGYHSVSESLLQESGGILYDMLNVISAWFLPFAWPVNWRIGILLGIGIGMIWIVFVFREKLWKAHHEYPKSLLFIMGLYLTLLLLLERVGYHETERYLSVIYPIFNMLIFILLDYFLANLQSPNYRKLILLVLALWLLYPLSRSLKNVNSWHERNCNHQLLSEIE